MNTQQYKNTIKIPIGKIILEGELIIPAKSKSLVIFSHGSGSSRFSTRNNFVANELHKNNIGTFLFDLLTKEEDEFYANRFNIDLLTERLVLVTKHLKKMPECSNLNFGYFGASTGAASAFKAAEKLPTLVQALVSRGGRPDLALDTASKIKAPTLLIVGQNDHDVLHMNREVLLELNCEKRLEVVPSATHLFVEPGTLREVALLAGDWFSQHLEKTVKEEITIK
jgi:putative phosphoribosyl transferase